MRPRLAISVFVLSLFGPGAPPGPAALAAAEVPDLSTFAGHLETLVPTLLGVSATPGVAIALVENGRMAYRNAFGSANIASGTAMTTDAIFNTGSISKTVSAWGVMRLVDAGKLDLDEPVLTYVPGLFESDSVDVTRITVRGLLSHTAGLSLSAVPEYHPDDARPDLEAALVDSANGVRVVHKPGTVWSYSGGGYMVLQLLIERVTGSTFAQFMQESVLRPLGMHDSFFTWTPEALAKAATGYDGEGLEVPYYVYVGQAAASLNSTVNDLSRFLIASLALEAADSILDPASIRLMQTPAPNAVQRFGLRYGLGYDIWNLSGGKLLVGHNGQNTGWASAAWVSPADRTGIVVLTNHSDGMDVWRWILCDWVQWREDTVWRGLCTERPASLPAALEFWKKRVEIREPQRTK